MEKEHLFIERKASDNKYLHRDFHVSADIGLYFVGENFGDEGVKEYLVQFAQSYYALLAKQIKEQGLKPLDEYLHKIFDAEERSDYIKTTLTPTRLDVEIVKCPALEFYAKTGHTPSKWYDQTTKTVYAELAKMAGLKFELYHYDNQSGNAKYAFICQ